MYLNMIPAATEVARIVQIPMRAAIIRTDAKKSPGYAFARMWLA
jgi:hypothetical protein